MDSGRSKDVLGGGAHWCNLANTIEPSTCGGNVTFLLNYFDHMFILTKWNIRAIKRLLLLLYSCISSSVAVLLSKSDLSS